MGQEPREEDLEKIKDKFFSNITHEFKTPLTLILGPVEQLLRTELDAHTRQRLLLVQRNALQLQRLIDELLDISKIENEDVVVEASNADLISIINHEDAVGALFGSSFEQQLITNKSEIPVMVMNPKAITTLGGVIGT